MTTFITSLVHFAQAYGQGSYNGCTYGCTNGPSGSGVLANTGTMVLLIVSLACLIIFVSLLVRFGRRPKRSKSLDSASDTVLQSDHKDKK